MADREASFVVAFDGKGGALQAVLGALKRDVRTTVADMQSAADSLQLFRNAQTDAAKASAAFEATRLRVVGLKKALEDAQSFGPVGKGLGAALAKDIALAEKAYLAAAKQVDKANVSLENSRNAARLTAQASVLLAAEQRKVGEEMAKATVISNQYKAAAEGAAASAKRLAQEQAGIAAAFQANKDALGFKSLRDVQPEIEKVRRAYQQLAASGKLSFGELSSASGRAQQRIAELKTDAIGVGAAFSQLRGSLIAIVASLAAITAGAVSSARAFRDFSQGMAAVETIAGLTKPEMAALSEEVRNLARTMGVDAVASTKALYEIISSGIPAGNAIDVLTLSTKAAIAGVTDVATAARVGVGALNGYGLQVGELAKVYDVLFKTVDSGIITLAELSANMGDVTPVARNAKVSIEEVAAMFVVLTRAQVGASEAATQIRAAIQNFASPAPEAAAKIKALGLQTGNFSNVIAQLAAKNYGPEIISQIAPDARAEKGILGLTQNFGLLTEQLKAMQSAAGATEAAYKIMANTPQARIDKFNSAISDLSISFGEFVTSATGFISSITGLVNSFNSLSSGTRQTVIQITALAVAFGGALLALKLMAPALNLFVGALFQTIPGLAAFKLSMSAAALAAGTLNVALAGIVGYAIGVWAADNVPGVSRLGDVLGSLFAAVARSGSITFGAFGRSLAETREQARQASEHFRTEFINSITGANARVRELTESQAQLREELGRASQATAGAVNAVQTQVGAILSFLNAAIGAVDKTIAELDASLGAINAKLASTVEQTKALSASVMANAEAEVAARLRALDALALGELQRQRKIIEIQKTAAAERLVLLNKATADAIAAFNLEATTRRTIAERTKQDLKVIDQGLARDRLSLLQSSLDQYRGFFAQLQAQQAGHVSAIKSLDAQRVSIAAEAEGKIRELQRGTLTVAQQYADKQMEVSTLLSQARLLLLKGETEKAEELAKRAISLAEGLGQKVVDGERIIVGAYDAQRIAVGALGDGYGVLLDINKQRKTVEETGAAAAKKSADEVKIKIDGLTESVKTMQQVVKDGLKIDVEVNDAQLTAVLTKLQIAQEEKNRLIALRVEATDVNNYLEALENQAKKGITINFNPGTMAIVQAALDKIVKSEPQLGLKVDNAITELKKVEEKADKLKSVKMQIDSNAKELQLAIDNLAKPTESEHKVKAPSISGVQTDIDKLKQPTSSVHTVHIDRVERNASGGHVGFSRGGLVGRPVQAFARGGPVFRRRSRSNPSMGGGRTTGVLPSSGAMPDGIQAQNFAEGGQVLSRDEIFEWAATLRKTYIKLLQLSYESRGLRRSSDGVNLNDWVNEILSKLGAYGRGRKKKISDAVSSNFEDWLSDIVEARRTGSPVTVGSGLAELRLNRGGPVFRRPSWSKVPGTGSGDTVPAALESGSFVVKKKASQKYGDPLMRALALGRLPIRTFAAGGRVKRDEHDDGKSPRPLLLSRRHGAPLEKLKPRSVGRKRLGRYGDAITSALALGRMTARQFARGGRVRTRWDDIETPLGNFRADGTEESGFFGDIQAGTKESQRDFDADIFGEPDLPKDPRALERKILEYRDLVMVAARRIDGSQYWGPALRAMAIDQKDYEQRPTVEKLATILKRARGVGLNLGITTSTRQGFDVDGRRFHKKIAKAPPGLGNPRLYSYDFFAKGGSPDDGPRPAGSGATRSRVSDTVRALLTPGEWVIRKPAVQAIERRFGRGVLDAINNMQAPSQLIRALRPQGPRIQHFAGGGQVGGEFGQNFLSPGAQASRVLTPELSDVARNNFYINVTAAAGALLSQENVRRFIVPVLDEITRRGR